jgi:hypothetical protein
LVQRDATIHQNAVAIAEHVRELEALRVERDTTQQQSAQHLKVCFMDVDARTFQSGLTLTTSTGGVSIAN